MKQDLKNILFSVISWELISGFLVLFHLLIAFRFICHFTDTLIPDYGGTPYITRNELI